MGGKQLSFIVMKVPWMVVTVKLCLLLPFQSKWPRRRAFLAMRIFSWNCRGAGKAPIVRAIKALSKESCPDVLFLAESKSSFSKMEYIRLKIGFEKCFVKRQRGVQEV